MTGLPVDISAIFTADQFESCEYSVKTKRVLIVYFCLDKPIGGEIKYPSIGHKNPNKTRVTVQNEDSSLNDQEVDVDVERMDRFYTGRFGGTNMEIVVFNNFNWKDDELEFTDLDEKVAGCDAFFFHFFTYLQIGDIGNGVDYRLQFDSCALPLEQIFDKIKSLKSFPSMALKPKIFIIQADDVNMLKPQTVKKAVPTTTTKKIPSDADILVIMSTIPQVLASKPSKQLTASNQPVRQPSSGDNAVPKCSMLVQAIVDVLEDQSLKDQDLFSITPHIHGRVQEIVENTDLGEQYKDYPIHLPTTHSTLTKFLYLKHSVHTGP